MSEDRELLEQILKEVRASSATLKKLCESVEWIELSQPLDASRSEARAASVKTGRRTGRK